MGIIHIYKIRQAMATDLNSQWSASRLNKLVRTSRQSLEEALDYLVNEGELTYTQDHIGTFYSLTKKGLERVKNSERINQGSIGN